MAPGLAPAAVRRRSSQLGEVAPTLDALTDAEQAELRGRQTFYRTLSHVNGGRCRETHLFEGLP